MNTPLKIWLGNQVLKAQRLLTSIGEKTGSTWLTYNPLVTMGFARAARRNAPIVIDSILSSLPKPATVADYGCGLGIYVKEFQDKGINAIGLEYNPRYQAIGRSKGLTILPWDLSLPEFQGIPTEKYDLVICLEVAEHIPATLADRLVSVLISSARTIIFTAAHPGQGGTGHINEQSREYWIEKYTHAGAEYDSATTQQLAQMFANKGAFSYLSTNLSVFRAPAPH
jgi:hypothetical protein